MLNEVRHSSERRNCDEDTCPGGYVDAGFQKREAHSNVCFFDIFEWKSVDFLKLVNSFIIKIILSYKRIFFAIDVDGC